MSSRILEAAETRSSSRPCLELLWLEITGKCQLKCVHCYAESGPGGGHGLMQVADWLGVIDQAAELGVGMVQFIGGEPTLHPALPRLVEHALDHGVDVEVYSNLGRVVPDPLWELFARPGVHLATSFYSDDAETHRRIVGGRPTLARTEANIARARELEIPLRVGLVRIREDQRIDGAIARLHELGVENIRTDDLRGVGRGTTSAPRLDALCGRCAGSRLAILPDGDTYPCVFSRWEELRVGNVLQQSLVDILDGQTLARARRVIATAKGIATNCIPDNGGCEPARSPCDPHCDPSVCQPIGYTSPTARPPSHHGAIGRTSPAARLLRAACQPNPNCGPNADGDACGPTNGDNEPPCPPTD